MRLFIAIRLSEEILTELVTVQHAFKQYGQMRCPVKENIHLTLKYLGEVRDEKRVADTLENVSFQQFSLSLSHVGTFHDKVLWAAFAENGALKELKKEIDSALPDFRDDHPFKPHITLARIQNLTDKKKFREELQREIPQLTMTVDHFSLVQSALLLTGPRYTEKMTFQKIY